MVDDSTADLFISAGAFLSSFFIVCSVRPPWLRFTAEHFVLRGAVADPRIDLSLPSYPSKK